MDMKNVKAIITGGVSGLGYGVAERVVADGGQAVLMDINDEKGAEAVATLGDAVSYIKTDVTSEQNVAEAVAEAANRMGSINLNVNCAGVIGAARALGREAPMPLDFFANTININLVGSFNVIKAAANLMQHNDPGEDNERGVIVCTASVAAFEGQIGQVAYSASKGGIVGMTMPLAREFSRFGVRVMTIAPGVFWTPMVDGMPDRIREALNESVPFPKRLGTAAEYADTVAYIVGNRYLNGETIRIDGAIRMQPK